MDEFLIFALFALLIWLLYWDVKQRGFGTAIGFRVLSFAVAAVVPFAFFVLRFGHFVYCLFEAARENRRNRKTRIAVQIKNQEDRIAQKQVFLEKSECIANLADLFVCLGDHSEFPNKMTAKRNAAIQEIESIQAKIAQLEKKL